MSAKERGYSMKPRHIPCHNVQATPVRIRNSMNCLLCAVRETRRLHTDLVSANPGWVVHHLNAHFSYNCKDSDVDFDTVKEPRCGLHGGGSLVSQHFTAIGACLGLLPFPLLRYAKIGCGTRSWDFWLSCGFSDDHYLEQSQWFMDALVTAKGQTRCVMEETQCAYARKANPRSHTWYCDMLPAGYHPYSFDDTKCEVNKTLPSGRMEPVLPLRVEFLSIGQYNTSGTNYWTLSCTKGLVPSRKRYTQKAKEPKLLESQFPLRSIVDEVVPYMDLPSNAAVCLGVHRNTSIPPDITNLVKRILLSGVTHTKIPKDSF